MSHSFDAPPLDRPYEGHWYAACIKCLGIQLFGGASIGPAFRVVRPLTSNSRAVSAMATHPNSDHDLDRTDELPRLDVEAYEAQLAAQQNETMGSTDTWAVQNLREAEDLEPSETTATVRFPKRSAPPEPPKKSDVTLDATRILGRIQQLESELAKANEREHELQERVELLTTELAAREKETRGLSADNARLAEQRSIVVERVRALEQQQREDTAQFERDLKQQRDLRAAENSAATTARLALEKQVAELSALAVQMREANARLEDGTKAAAKLANNHIQLIEQFKQRVAAEEKNSAQLARHLAAKIAEQATISQEIARRDATIEALTEARDDLAALLEQTNRKNEALVASLTAERDGLVRALAEERETKTQAQETLSARAQEIDELQGSSAALQTQIAALRQQLATEQARHRETTDQLRELEHAVSEGQLARDDLASELETMRARVQQLEADAQNHTDAVAALDAKTNDLQQAQEELETARRELEALAARDLEREESVLASAAELAAARRQLNQQATTVQSLEQAIRARDTLTDRLRAELQVSQDERAIMAGQLEKSRARNKSIAREIFARDNQIAALKADLAVHVETLATIRQDVSRAAADGEHVDRILEPVGHDGDSIVLDKKMMTIGRTSDNDICIPSKLVSRSHARLLIGPNAVIVEDAGSTNGCLVNDVLVKQQLMREGDVLSIGDLKYRLRTRADSVTRTRATVIPFGEGRSAD